MRSRSTERTDGRVRTLREPAQASLPVFTLDTISIRRSPAPRGPLPPALGLIATGGEGRFA